MRMERDFFDENQGQMNSERIPAPVAVGKKPKKSKPRWVHVVLAICIGVFTFFVGYLTCWLTLDPEMRTLISVKKNIQKNYYQEITDEEFYAAIFGGINGGLLDDYSGYMTPEEFASVQADLEGNRIGVGLVFQGLRIVRVCGNSPADEAGVLVGESVTACGKTEDTLSPCESFQDFSDFLAPYGEGEEFYVQFTSETGVRNLKLHKSAYVESNVFYRTDTSSYLFVGDASEKKERTDYLPCLGGDAAYIRLVQFTGNAAEDFDAAMAQFKADGKKHLVLDLRGNGGGLLDIMQSIAGYFCKNTTEKEPIAAVADYGERRVGYPVKKNVYAEYFSADSRICVLADNGSASASECLLGCMLDYEAIAYGDICLAERSGETKTFGKGIMQETYIISLAQQNALKLTTAEIRWPVSDNSIHGRGILPSDGTLTVAEDYNYEQETIAAIEKLFG